MVPLTTVTLFEKLGKGSGLTSSLILVLQLDYVLQSSLASLLFTAKEPEAWSRLDKIRRLPPVIFSDSCMVQRGRSLNCEF